MNEAEQKPSEQPEPTGILVVDNFEGQVSIFYRPYDDGGDELIWCGDCEYFCTEQGRAEAIVVCEEKGFAVPDHWRTERYLSYHETSERAQEANDRR